MNQVFLELPEEKQESIIKAALVEFGTESYERASTNTITKQAGISKGMLFYYFNNKNELFNNLTDFVIRETSKRFAPLLAQGSQDYIEWLYSLSKVKLQFQQEHPEALRFLGQLFVSGDIQYLNDATRASFEENVEQSRKKVASQINTCLFRDDIPSEMSQKMVGWIMDGYQQELIAHLENDSHIWDKENLDTLWNEYYEFLEVVKRIFYKKGDLS